MTDHVGTGGVYPSLLPDWDTRSSVRAAPRRMVEEARDGLAYFAADLTPVARHPLVQERGPSAVDELLARRLYLYLDFTLVLEQDWVNPTLQRLARNSFSIDLPPALRLDALRIYTDEAYHALLSADLSSQVEAATGWIGTGSPEPAFVRAVRRARAAVPPALADLVELCFATVSETLISGVLSAVPLDPKVVTAVREAIADHAEDERRHHAYFTRLLERFWPQLDRSEQAVLGPLFADFIVAFLDPDVRGQQLILIGMGFDGRQAEEIVRESHHDVANLQTVRRAGRFTLRLLERVGVLGDEATRERFVRLGLMDR